MKSKLFILSISFLFFASASYSQVANDSVRTRNDKPGTPQSLRTPDMSPQSHVTLLNTKAAPNQNASGTNTANANGQTIITVPNTDNTNVPKTPITLQNKATNRLDTIPKAVEPISNKAPNVTNPIRN